eukprot:TRINITY_DN2746_c0_g1_i1.p1 TRINITY_DN2746_c0_g1~~TRINITY_DN2746_c0_g1_i1.p1  ORF type:complete len:203 (-),score=12.01 TRINITY_DN2746_c0_g1_i1:4-612(-)
MKPIFTILFFLFVSIFITSTVCSTSAWTQQTIYTDSACTDVYQTQYNLNGCTNSTIGIEDYSLNLCYAAAGKFFSGSSCSSDCSTCSNNATGPVGKCISNTVSWSITECTKSVPEIPSTEYLMISYQNSDDCSNMQNPSVIATVQTNVCTLSPRRQYSYYYACKSGQPYLYQCSPNNCNENCTGSPAAGSCDNFVPYTVQCG